MIRAFIFDMDGTLIDSEILWVEAVRIFLAERELVLNREEALALVYGRSTRDIHDELKRRFARVDFDLDEMNEALRPYFVRLRDSRDIRIPSSIDLLKRLSRDYPVCLVSGSSAPEVVAGVKMMGLAEQLEFFLSADDYHPGKPDPACFLLAAERLGARPEECLVFEDSSAGVQAAKRAGMFCVALARVDRPRQDVALADRVLADLAEFDLAEVESR